MNEPSVKADPAAFRMHHVGCLVEDIEQSAASYAGAMSFRHCSEIYSVSSQQVKVCFIDVGSGVFLELVQPVGETSLSQMLGRGTSYYHVGYLVDDFDGAIEQLTAADHLLLSTFSSEAFEGRRCAFLFTPERAMIELIESPA